MFKLCLMPLFLSIKSYPHLNIIFCLIIFYNTDTVVSDNIINGRNLKIKS